MMSVSRYARPDVARRLAATRHYIDRTALKP